MIARSKPLIAAVLLLFVVVLVRESFAQIEGQAQSEFTKAFQAGKKLYEDGEHKEAALKFAQALTSAKEKGDIGEACFYLSLSYYSLGESDNAQLYLKMMFEAQPEREIDARLFPSGFLTLFYRTKSELAKPQPAKLEEKTKVEAKAEEKKAELEKKAADEEKKPVAVGGKAEAASEFKKKGKFPWLIVGGLVVVTGVVLYLLSKKKSPDRGTLAVESWPSRAVVFLDGADTGLTTACTLTNVSPGKHLLKLVKDGYADFQQDVTVVAGQTATVRATLTVNAIVVTSPASGMIWGQGTTNDIRWQVSSGLSGEKRMAAPALSGSAVLAPQRTRAGSGISFPPDPSLMENGREYRPEAQSEAVRILGIAKVKIGLYKGGALVSVIVEETDNSGSYSWQVPGTSSDGSDYKVRVSCSTDSSIYGESGYFTIWTKRYEFVIKWGVNGSGEGQFNQPSGIAVDNSGYVYVADSGNHRIQKFMGSGVLATKWGSYGNGDSQFGYPSGIAADNAGFIYVVEYSNNRIQKFTSTGGFVAKYGGPGTGDGQLDKPQGIVVDNSGNMYVADNGNNRVQKFNYRGEFLAKWGGQGAGDGQFKGPHGIAMDGSGNIYVVDSENNRIQKFTSTGTFLAKWGSYGNGDAQFGYPWGIAVDPLGNVIVSDLNNGRVQKFSSSGTFLTNWGSLGSGDGQFDWPQGVSTDNSGNVYVADQRNSRIQKFRPTTSAPFDMLFQKKMFNGR